MKIRFWDRVLATLYVLLSLALCVFVALRSLGLDVIGNFYERLTLATSYWYLIYFGVLIIIVLLGVYVLRLFFARKPRKTNFVTVDSGDNGKVIISLEALEQMVRQAVRPDPDISDMKIEVSGHDDAVSALLELAVKGGAHLPTITMNLQRDIRRYVEVNSGVAVRDVTVKVASVLPPSGKHGRDLPWKKKAEADERPATEYFEPDDSPVPPVEPAEEKPALEPEPAEEPEEMVLAADEEYAYDSRADEAVEPAPEAEAEAEAPVAEAIDEPDNASEKIAEEAPAEPKRNDGWIRTWDDEDALEADGEDDEEPAAEAPEESAAEPEEEPKFVADAGEISSDDDDDDLYD